MVIFHSYVKLPEGINKNWDLTNDERPRVPQWTYPYIGHVFGQPIPMNPNVGVCNHPLQQWFMMFMVGFAALPIITPSWVARFTFPGCPVRPFELVEFKFVIKSRQIHMFVCSLETITLTCWICILVASTFSLVKYGQCFFLVKSHLALVFDDCPLLIKHDMGVSENSVFLNPMVNDHYPY